MTFSKAELELLSTVRGLTYLLTTDPPDLAFAKKRTKYNADLVSLQVELNRLQNWTVEYDKRLLIVLEGGEFCGRGDAIRAFMERLNPRSARLVALPKPTKIESGQWYLQRYVEQLPKPGEVVFFNRSWYNRAIVEPVNGFCTQKEYKQFMKDVNFFERMICNDGIILLKLFLNISKATQAERIENVRKSPLRSWELTKVDKKAQKLWPKTKTYEKAMLEKTNTKEVPWKIIDCNDQLAGNLNSIQYVLDSVPYLD